MANERDRRIRHEAGDRIRLCGRAMHDAERLLGRRYDLV